MTVSIVASTLAFTVAIGRGYALHVPLDVPQDAEHFELHRVLRDGVYRLVLWLWWIIVFFVIGCSYSELLNHDKYVCVTSFHILTELRVKHVHLMVSCLLHCRTSDFFEF